MLQSDRFPDLSPMPICVIAYVSCCHISEPLNILYSSVVHVQTSSLECLLCCNASVVFLCCLNLVDIFYNTSIFFVFFELDRPKQKNRAGGLQYLRRVICKTSGGYFAIPGGVNADGLQYLPRNLLRAPSG